MLLRKVKGVLTVKVLRGNPSQSHTKSYR